MGTKIREKELLESLFQNGLNNTDKKSKSQQRIFKIFGSPLFTWMLWWRKIIGPTKLKSFFQSPSWTDILEMFGAADSNSGLREGLLRLEENLRSKIVHYL